MGPKSGAETQSYTPVKHLSWIDRMYQKLEDIYVEVDNKPSLLIQETSKYVENQMNVVGTNVKKICAELIQDLLPPPDEMKFDCPIHWKCDCKDLEKLKQGGSYMSAQDAKQESRGIEPQEAHKIEAQKTVMDSTRMEEKMAGITSEQKEIGNSETIILTKAKVEKQLVIVNSIMSEEKFSQVVIENVEKFGEGIIIENDEKLEDIELYLEESGRENIFVDQATISKQEHNDVSKTEHSGSYRGCFGDVNEKHLTKENSGRWYDSRQESGINTICEIFIRDRQVMEDQGEHGIWCKEGTTQLMMQQKELKTVDYLQNNSNNCIENNIYGSNVCNGKGRDVELPVHEMGDDVKCMYSPTKSLKVVGKKLEEADDSVPTFNHMSSNEHHEFMKGKNSMGASRLAFEANDEDEQQSARWFVSASQRNIFEHGNSNPCLFDKLSSTDCDLEEFESDWVLI